MNDIAETSQTRVSQGRGRRKAALAGQPSIMSFLQKKEPAAKSDAPQVTGLDKAARFKKYSEWQEEHTVSADQNPEEKPQPRRSPRKRTPLLK